MKRTNITPLIAVAGCLLSVAAGISGCSMLGGAGLGGGRASAEVTSVERGAQLTPTWRTAVYSSPDVNTADVILSDLDQETLMAVISDESRRRTADGSILRVRMFITPRAGRTPIDYTASNASATLLVMSGGEIGVYGGGGFMLPSGKPGGRHFSGRLRDATLKPAGATDGFDDLLGASDLSGRVSASRDEASASRVAAWIGAVVGELAPHAVAQNNE